MNNGLYHIQDNKIYQMSLNEPMKKLELWQVMKQL